MKEFKTDFDCKQKQYDTGAMRSSQENKGRFDLIPSGPWFRLAKVYERGAKKHGERNWEKGFPIGRAIDSAIRHLLQYRDRLDDEDHPCQAIWNICAAVHFEEMIEKGVLDPKLDDRPIYKRTAAREKLTVKDLKPDDLDVRFLSNSNIVKVLHKPTQHSVTAFKGKSRDENYGAALQELVEILEHTNEYRVVQTKHSRFEIVDCEESPKKVDISCAEVISEKECKFDKDANKAFEFPKSRRDIPLAERTDGK